MKKILTIMALTVAAVSIQAQGFIYFNNANNSKISVNTTVGGPATGLTPATAGAYYYALFYSASATTVDGSAASVTGAGNYAFNDPNWSFSNPSTFGTYTSGPGYAASIATAGRFNALYIDPSQTATMVGFTTAAQFVIVGWSSNIGTNITQVTQWLAAPTVNGWIGESDVSGPIAPGNPAALPVPGLPVNVFGPTATLGVCHAFTLGEVAAVPEPTTIALFGLGGLALLAFRRRQ